MLMDNLAWGLVVLILWAPVAFVAVCIFYGIKFLIKRKIDFSFKDSLCELLLLLFIIAILHITGVIEGFTEARFGITSIFTGNVWYSLIPFEDGINLATILNIILFIPFGFFSSSVFKNLRTKQVYIILIGFSFSVCIEFIQSFCGRCVQLEDVLMNTLGTFIGYQVYIYLLKFKVKKNLI